MNAIALIGRLTRDPENRSCRTTTCAPFAWPSPAQASRGEDPGAVVVDVVTFAGLARSCEHLTKVVRWRSPGAWSSPSGRTPPASALPVTRLIADEVTFLGVPKAGAGPA